MAEPRRVPLLQVKTSFSNEKAPSVGEKDKSNKKDDKESSEDQPTIRLEISLKDSTEKTCPEYSYAKLIKDQVKSDGKLDESGLQDPFNDDDDDDQLKALAKKFEDKYNPKLSEKGRKRKHDSNPYYHDIGYGYDESDPFVDNAEAYDELVPADWTTQHGGFYINQGELHYRPMADNDLKDFKSPKKRRMIENKKVKTKDGEKSASKTPKELSTQKRKKQLLNKEKKQKKLESALFGEKEKKRKKKIIIDDSEDSPVPLARQIKKDASLHSQPSTSFPSKSLLNGVTQSSKDSSAIESVMKSSKYDIKNDSVKLKNAAVLLEKSQNEKTNLNNDAIQAKGQFLNDIQASLEMRKNTGSPGKAGNLNKMADESSVTPKGSTKEAEVPSSPPQLLENLPLILEAGVQSLKDAAANCSNGKCRFFDVSVNKTLLGVARTLSKLPCKVRTTVYDYLAFYLPCTKDTLVKRAKTLLIEDQVNQMDAPMQKLKDAIEKEMPHQKKLYDAEVANALTEQVREQMKQSGFPSTNDSSLGKPSTPSDEKEGQSTSDTAMTPTEDKSKKNMPKRKFNWTEEIRRLLCDVVTIKVQLYKMSKSRSLTAEEYVKDFLENDVRKLWPKGWMTSRILFKESKSAHQDITQPTSKVKKVTKKPELSTSLMVGNSSANSNPENAKLKSNLSLSNLLQARNHSLSSVDMKGKFTSVSQALKTSTVSTKTVNITKSGVIKKETEKSQPKKISTVKATSDSKMQKLSNESKQIRQELQSALSAKVSVEQKNIPQVAMNKDKLMKNVVILNPFEPSNQPMKSPNEAAVPVKLNRKPSASKAPDSSGQVFPNFDGIQSILDYAASTEGVKRNITPGRTADQSHFRRQLSQESTKPKSTTKTSISPKHQAPLAPPAMSSSHFGVWSTKSPIMSSLSTVHSSATSQHTSKHVSPPKCVFEDIAQHMMSPSKPTGTQSSSRSSFKTPPSESHRSISATPPKSSPQNASPHSAGSAGSTRTSPLLHFPPNLDPKRRLSGHSPEDKRGQHAGISHSISRLTRDPSPQHSSFSSLPYSSTITSFSSALPAQVAPQVHDQLHKMTSQQHSLPTPSPLDIMFRQQQQQQQLQLHMKQRQAALQQQQQLLKQHSQQQQQQQQQQLSSALGTPSSTMSTSEHYPSPYTKYRPQFS